MIRTGLKEVCAFQFFATKTKCPGLFGHRQNCWPKDNFSQLILGHPVFNEGLNDVQLSSILFFIGIKR